LIFNGGGTGSVQLSREDDALTEITIGSGFLCSHLFDYYAGLSLEPALFFAVQAVRRPAPRIVTCAGGGIVASGEVGKDRQPKPVWPRGLSLLPREGAGEVQTPLRLGRGCEVELGQPVLFRPAKAGELAERFREYLLVRDGLVEARVPTYRGLEQCF
jgi:hypothetical protein